jgi:hypothetical protein
MNHPAWLAIVKGKHLYANRDPKYSIHLRLGHAGTTTGTSSSIL